MEMTQTYVGLLVTGLLLFALIGYAVYRVANAAKIHDEETERYLVELNADETIKKFLDEGYLFCFFWNIEDIHRLGKNLNFYLTNQDCVKIACLIKEKFDPERGISNDIIREAILAYCSPAGEEIGRQNFDNGLG